MAGILLQSGASITLEDSKGRIPVDLLSGPVLQAVCDGHSSGIHYYRITRFAVDGVVIVEMNLIVLRIT